MLCMIKPHLNSVKTFNRGTLELIFWRSGSATATMKENSKKSPLHLKVKPMAKLCAGAPKLTAGSKRLVLCKEKTLEDI